ncbi:hypothetical protein BJX63DRAFT_239312 [Aspergillus granulosus]|uniref:F-box domain-containing protein n=1 Tax=Aspergillus granulosus TaxID=176169 RepID=A0ABR4HBS0_9EURO
MAQLLSLPIEILDRIFSLVDLETCKALRLANQPLSSIGQRWVFDTAVVCPSDASCDRLNQILENTKLASFVTKIYLNTWDQERDIEGQYYEIYQDEDDNSDNDAGLHPRFWGVFDRLKDFPRLQNVVLRFHHKCDEDDMYDVPQSTDFRSAVMTRFIDALSALPQPVQGLGLQDIENINPTEVETVAKLQQVLGSVRSLRLNITNVSRGMSGSSDIHRDAPQRFHSELPSFWLKPAMSNLEHFTLYSSLLIGFFPICDLRGIHFPRLKTLALGNYTFIHDSQLEWILSHGSTLTELYMDDCAIVWEAGIYDREDEPTLLPREDFRTHPGLPDGQLYTSYSKRWVDYFRAFESDLPNLLHFRFGHSPYWWDEDTTPFERESEIQIGFHEECYTVFCDGFLPSEYMEHMIWRMEEDGQRKYVEGQRTKPSEEDRRALVELCAKVGQSITLHDGDFLEER